MTTVEIEQMLMHSMMERGFLVFAERINIASSEYDVVGINKNDYVYEYEIKQSRADFKADFKKVSKHIKLESRKAYRMVDIWKQGKRTGEQYKQVLIPNRFFYVCNENMIKIEEIPEYAGLIYVKDGVFWEVKGAPLLHREKAPVHTFKSICITMCERGLLGCAKMTYLNNKIKHAAV